MPVLREREKVLLECLEEAQRRSLIDLLVRLEAALEEDLEVLDE
nr:hypothetical protein [Afifella pfennigii]